MCEQRNEGMQGREHAVCIITETRENGQERERDAWDAACYKNHEKYLWLNAAGRDMMGWYIYIYGLPADEYFPRYLWGLLLWCGFGNVDFQKTNGSEVQCPQPVDTFILTPEVDVYTVSWMWRFIQSVVTRLLCAQSYTTCRMSWQIFIWHFSSHIVLIFWDECHRFMMQVSMMKKATNKWGITDPDTVADSQSQPKKISKNILRTGHVDMTPENADVGCLLQSTPRFSVNTCESLVRELHRSSNSRTVHHRWSWTQDILAEHFPVICCLKALKNLNHCELIRGHLWSIGTTILCGFGTLNHLGRYS